MKHTRAYEEFLLQDRGYHVATNHYETIHNHNRCRRPQQPPPTEMQLIDLLSPLLLESTTSFPAPNQYIDVNAAHVNSMVDGLLSSFGRHDLTHKYTPILENSAQRYSDACC
jgi:hypothetical protein